MRVPAHEIYFTFSRSGGPGGQNVNKVNSRATLHWYPAQSALAAEIKERFQARYGTRLTTLGELTISSDRYRDQRRNVKDCLDKLEQLLAAVASPPKRRRPTRPSRSSKEKRLQTKKLRARLKASRRALDDS